MMKYQIVETSESFNHAGSKATQDIADIAEMLGYKRLFVRMNTTKATEIAKVQRQIGYYFDWNHCYNAIDEGSVILLQHPFHYKQLTRQNILEKLKNKKHVKFISLVHDVEELRLFRYNNYYKQEFAFMLDIADTLIVHNDRMMNFFIKHGIPRERLVNLQIFDYLQKPSGFQKPTFEKSITIAGNLDTEKCGYISQLGKLNDVTVKLFGPNYNKQLSKHSNIQYMGSFPANDIPSKLTSGFGLVWDGSSIEGCLGDSGQYLKYNNPHKLSLYLSSGLPVVIWNGAAEAPYVKVNGVGICVDSLCDLEAIFSKISQTDYSEMLNAVEKVSNQLIEGQYAKKAIREAETYLGE